METDPFLVADTYITRGSAKAIVCCVGEHSTRGIEEEVFDVNEHQTDLTRRLDNIGGSLKFIGLITSVCIFGASILIVIINKAAVDDYGAGEFMNRLISCFIVALIMLVVAIPEGLPMTVAVSLAYSVLQMSEDDKVLVRDVESIERVGQITDLVLGKTGTMTTEEMEVHSFFAQNVRFINSRKDSLVKCELDERVLEKIVESICWNSSAWIEMSQNCFYIPEGQGTEVSLIKWLQGAEKPVHEYMQKKFTDIILATVPFDSNLKKSIVAVKHPVVQNTVRVYVKGAPEYVLPNCLTHFDELGQRTDLDGPTRDYIMDNILNNQMTMKGLRVMAFSYSDMPLEAFEELQERT